MIDTDRPLETSLLGLARPQSPPIAGLADIPPPDEVVQEHLIKSAEWIRTAQATLLRIPLKTNKRGAVQSLIATLHEAIEEAEHAAATLRLQAMTADGGEVDHG